MKAKLEKDLTTYQEESRETTFLVDEEKNQSWKRVTLKFIYLENEILNHVTIKMNSYEKTHICIIY